MIGHGTYQETSSTDYNKFSVKGMDGRCINKKSIPIVYFQKCIALVFSVNTHFDHKKN